MTFIATTYVVLKDISVLNRIFPHVLYCSEQARTVVM